LFAKLLIRQYTKLLFSHQFREITGFAGPPHLEVAIGPLRLNTQLKILGCCHRLLRAKVDHVYILIVLFVNKKVGVSVFPESNLGSCL